jgi:glycosyltransferase involved in cell wall biosynthesis
VWADYPWILNKDCPAALPSPRSGPLRINWLIPYVGKASGGFLGVFRAIHQLERWGHQQRIYVVGRSPLGAAQSTEVMRKHYFPIQTEIELFSGTVADCDALVATLWKTAYTARNLGNTARKFYFVQDLEHLFYPAGSLSEFVKQTYQWGFYGITLGQWIADVLQGEFGMECSPFGFSYDREVYSLKGIRRPADGRKRVLFYARPITERRGLELGILALLLVARQMPDTEFVLVGSQLRPSELPFPAILPGVVDPPELAVWYRSCDVALVLSFTNLSLLPLELMACGCPVVSNTGPNVEWLLTRETTQLAESTPEALANAIVELLQNDELRARKSAAGLASAQTTDWTTEIRKIESAFYRGLNIASLPPSGYDTT